IYNVFYIILFLVHYFKVFFIFVFFFSSRRRHTRLQGDWSSDVYSSDLGPELPLMHRPRSLYPRTLASQIDNLAKTPGTGPWIRPTARGLLTTYMRSNSSTRRSEERRVGKEGKARRKTEGHKEKEKTTSD